MASLRSLVRRAKLYSKPTVAVILLVLLGTTLLQAQYRKRRKQHALRAIGVVVWPATGKGSPTLEPLVILADGQYYDASVYMASPVPMAAQPGVEYEIQKSGLPVGLFTVNRAQQIRDEWFALGSFEQGNPNAPVVASKSSKPPAESEDDQRPILRRPADEKPAPSPTTSTPPVAPPSSTPTTTSPSPAASAPPPSAPAASESTESADNDVPQRPILRRGKPKPQENEEIPEEIAHPAKKSEVPAATAKPAPAPPPSPKMMVAVSDAQPSEERSFLLNWPPEQESGLTKQMVTLARQEIVKWAAFRGQKRGEWPLEDVQIKFFDLFLDNYPEIVLTARQPVGPAPAAPKTRRRAGTRASVKHKETTETPVLPPAEVYVTVVARADLDNNLHKLFVSITDARHLDVSPRLELIDAVDANGEGYGELLFRKVWNDRSPVEGNVTLYAVGPDNLVELFDTTGE